MKRELDLQMGHQREILTYVSLLVCPAFIYFGGCEGTFKSIYRKEDLNHAALGKARYMVNNNP